VRRRTWMQTWQQGLSAGTRLNKMARWMNLSMNRREFGSNSD
jgi:hypothetical protein